MSEEAKVLRQQARELERLADLREKRIEQEKALASCPKSESKGDVVTKELIKTGGKIIVASLTGVTLF